MTATAGAPANEKTIEVVNTQYVLCFTVILTFSFSVIPGQNGGAPSVEPTVSLDRLPTVSLFLLYFLLDWTSWLLIKRHKLDTVPVFFGTMAGVVLTTVVILALYSANCWKYFAVGLYGVIVGLWDTAFQLWRTYKRDSLRAAASFLLAGMRLMVAVFFSAAAIAGLALRPELLDAVATGFPWVVATLVMLKALRLLTFFDEDLTEVVPSV